MYRNNLLKELEIYGTSKLCTMQEKSMLNNFIQFISSNDHCFERSNKGHITSSVWIINAQRTHALLTHHKKLDIWVQLGGHNDGQIDCKKVAAQEALEESGIQDLFFLHEGIFDIDIHAIPGRCAYHYDVRYLMQAKNDQFIISDESHDLAWAPFDKINDYSKEASVLRLNEKFIQLF